jgi:hypothetical protein
MKYKINGALRIVIGLGAIFFIWFAFKYQSQDLKIDFSNSDKSAATTGIYTGLLMVLITGIYMFLNAARQFKKLPVKYKLMYILEIPLFILLIFTFIPELKSDQNLLTLPFISCDVIILIMSYFVVIDFVFFFLTKKIKPITKEMIDAEKLILEQQEEINKLKGLLNDKNNEAKP